jgi:hypothetical protein
MIKKPGLYPGIPEVEYHADPVVEPSLSSSICKLLVNRSPRHAKYEHPRLSPERLEEIGEATRAMDKGSAFHKLMLGAGQEIVPLAYDDYRKNDAKDERDAARKAGRIPVLAPDMADVTAMVTAAKDQLADHGMSHLFEEGVPEVTMVWREKIAGRKPIWLRGRLDFLHLVARKGGHIVVPEVKTTEGSAHPDDWQSTFFEKGYDYQSCLYERGLMDLIDDIRSVEFVWIVVEQKPPYGLSVVRLGNQGREEVEPLVEKGIEMWSHCIETGRWPGYDPQCPPIDPPFWRSNQKEARRLALINRLSYWQRPVEKVQ